MSIHFKCNKCGRTLKVTDENKFGARARCSECHAVTKIPGIAMQDQASGQQIEHMQAALNQHYKALWIFFVLVPVQITLYSFAAFYPFLKWPVFLTWLVFIFSAFLLLDRMSTSRKYLGRSNVTSILLFVALGLIWAILCVTSYLHLRSRLVYLQKAGARDNDV